MDNQAVIQALEKRFEDLLLRHGKLEASLRHAEGLPDDWQDRANHLFNEEVMDAIDVHDREELVAIREALLRLQQGVYGICQVCHEPIGQRRLLALPFAVQCVDCAA